MRKKDRASVSHDEALVQELRADPVFAVEYLQAAMEDANEPLVQVIALRHVSEAFWIVDVVNAVGVNGEEIR